MDLRTYVEHQQFKTYSEVRKYLNINFCRVTDVKHLVPKSKINVDNICDYIFLLLLNYDNKHNTLALLELMTKFKVRPPKHTILLRHMSATLNVLQGTISYIQRSRILSRNALFHNLCNLFVLYDYVLCDPMLLYDVACILIKRVQLKRPFKPEAYNAIIKVFMSKDINGEYKIAFHKYVSGLLPGLTKKNLLSIFMKGPSSFLEPSIYALFSSYRLTALESIALSLSVSKFKYTDTALQIFALTYRNHISELNVSDFSKLTVYINSISHKQNWSTIVTKLDIPLRNHSDNTSILLQQLKKLLHKCRLLK